MSEKNYGPSFRTLMRSRNQKTIEVMNIIHGSSSELEELEFEYENIKGRVRSFHSIFNNVVIIQNT